MDLISIGISLSTLVTLRTRRKLIRAVTPKTAFRLDAGCLVIPLLLSVLALVTAYLPALLSAALWGVKAVLRRG